MASNKTGFNYYNVDTDRYQDIKIKRLKKELGCSGLAVYDYILCEVYRVRGCYLEFDENVNFDIAEYLQESEEFITKVLESCFKIGLFDLGMYEKYSVITSRSIQERYIQMSMWSKRKSRSIPDLYDLINPATEKVVTRSEEVPEEVVEIPEENSNPPEKTEKNAIKDEFELFRKRYPGTKRGLDTEFENFKKKHKDYKEVVSLLAPALEALITWREQKKMVGQFVPEYANLSTWINQRRWEVELEKITLNGTNRKDSESVQRKHHISAEAARISGANA